MATAVLMRSSEVDEQVVAADTRSVRIIPQGSSMQQSSRPSIVQAPIARANPSKGVSISDVPSEGLRPSSGEEVRLGYEERIAGFRRPSASRKDKGAEGGEEGAARSFGSLPRLCSAGHDVALQLRRVAHEVSAHYKADFCVIALHRADGGLSVLAHQGIHREAVENAVATDPSAFSFFRHHVARDLPIIIEDTHDVPTVRDDPLVVEYPKIRFYAAAPLSTGSGKYTGTISIGSMQRRTFRLEAAGILRQKAAEAVAIMKSSAWKPKTGGA